MDDARQEGVRRLAANTESGASELLPRALELLRRGRDEGRETLEAVARGVCAAQPSMASLWNAAAAALADLDAGGDRLALVERRSRRAGEALQRVAVDLLGGGGAVLSAPSAGSPGRETGALHVTTYSFSGTVLAVLRGLSDRLALTVACAEGRPAFEGRRLAAALSDERIAVEFHSDAGIGVALARTDALLVGADAIAPAWFFNKCGTHSLSVAAATLGVPVYVLATRDKFIASPLEALLSIADHDPAEIWSSPPASVRIRNPYFEQVPLAFVSALVTDAGVLGADAAAEVCRANGEGISKEIADRLRAG